MDKLDKLIQRFTKGQARIGLAAREKLEAKKKNVRDNIYQERVKLVQGKFELTQLVNSVETRRLREKTCAAKGSVERCHQLPWASIATTTATAAATTATSKGRWFMITFLKTLLDKPWVCNK